MLAKFRIEVVGDDAGSCVEELAKYEHALQVTECRRYGLKHYPESAEADYEEWGMSSHDRSFYNALLGRDVTEEVIEMVPGEGYRGRRVIHFTRIDNRHMTEREE